MSIYLRNINNNCENKGYGGSEESLSPIKPSKANIEKFTHNAI